AENQLVGFPLPGLGVGLLGGQEPGPPDDGPARPGVQLILKPVQEALLGPVEEGELGRLRQLGKGQPQEADGSPQALPVQELQPVLEDGQVALEGLGGGEAPGLVDEGVEAELEGDPPGPEPPAPEAAAHLLTDLG